MIAVVTPAWYGLLAMLERRHPHDPEWNPPSSEVATDGAFFPLISIAALGGQALGAGLVHQSGSPGRGRAARLGVGPGVAASVVAFDLVHYTLHRLGHEWGPGWTFHSVHHSPTRLHIFNATRFHPAETALEGLLEGIALGLAGFSPAQHISHSVARATYGQLQHCNIDLDSGPLDFVFATPDLHRWHHSEIYAEGDTNYGAITSVWDQLFGTLFRPRRELDSPLGVGRMPDFPQRFGDLLRVPLEWPAIRSANADTWFAPEDPNPDLHARL